MDGILLINLLLNKDMDFFLRGVIRLDSGVDIFGV